MGEEGGPLSRERNRQTRRKLRVWILLGLLLIALALMFVTQYFLGGGGIESPEFNLQAIILVFLTVLNVLLILILVLVLSRYIIKIFFERTGRRFGASVKTKLLLTFMVLAILPTGLFIFLSYEVINKSVNQWFSAPAEEILHNSEELARQYYASAIKQSQEWLKDFLDHRNGQRLTGENLGEFRATFHLTAVQVLNDRGRILNSSQDPTLSGPFRLKSTDLVLQNAGEGEIGYFVDNHADHDDVICFTRLRQPRGRILLTVQRIPGSIAYRAFRINEAYEEYFLLKYHVQNIRLIYFLVIGLAGGIMLFAFVWFSVYISKKITIPVQELLMGAQRVAAGDLSNPIRCEAHDEFGVLIEAFNRMMRELQENKTAIDRANRNLQLINQELEHRNTFIQTVLDTVATGVVSMDEQQVITISNSAARHLLKQRKIIDGVTSLQEMVPREKYQELTRLLKETEFHQRVSREIVFRAGRRSMHFVVTATLMKDFDGTKTGYVIVFDDVSDLIRTEKAAAWQEVARRLAHEIKNPLTPIQLSMERIRKQYHRLLESGAFPESPETVKFGQILDQALKTAQMEIRTLKYLVAEFSRFARLPVPALKPLQLNSLIEEVALRYRRSDHPVQLDLKLEDDLPEIYADSNLIARVIINLVDNAMEAVQEVAPDGRIVLASWYDETTQRVLVTIEDNGKGIDDEIWDQLFLPYFSTKEGGMGLGLTFVKKILDDHDAGVRVENLSPTGCRFEVEFRNIKLPNHVIS